MKPRSAGGVSEVNPRPACCTSGRSANVCTGFVLAFGDPDTGNDPPEVGMPDVVAEADEVGVPDEVDGPDEPVSAVSVALSTFV